MLSHQIAPHLNFTPGVSILERVVNEIGHRRVSELLVCFENQSRIDLNRFPQVRRLQNDYRALPSCLGKMKRKKWETAYCYEADHQRCSLLLIIGFLSQSDTLADL